MLEVVLGLILVIIMGIVAIIKPEWVWKFDHFLTVKNGEPSDFYITITRVAGVFLVLIASPIIIFSSLFQFFG